MSASPVPPLDAEESGPSSGRDAEVVARVGDRTVGRRAALAAAAVGLVGALALKSWVFWLFVCAWPLYELLARRIGLSQGDPAVARVQIVGTRLRVLRAGHDPFERDHTRATRRQVWHRPDGSAVVELDWPNGDRVLLDLPHPERAEQILRVGGARWNARRILLARGDRARSTYLLSWVGSAAAALSALVAAWWLLFALSYRWRQIDMTYSLTWLLASLGALWGLGRARDDRWVVVGHDGLAFEGRAPRFVPYSAIRSVERHPEGLEIAIATAPEDTGALSVAQVIHLRPSGVPALEGGIDARTVFRSGRHEDALRAREDLLAAIEVARTADRRAEGEALAGALRRGKRNLRRWAEDLTRWRELRVASYRQTALDPEALARLTEDPHAPLEARIAAAYAAQGSEDPELRRKLRIAVDTTVDETAHRALSLAAEGELAAALRVSGIDPGESDEALSEAERDAEALAEAEAALSELPKRRSTGPEP